MSELLTDAETTAVTPNVHLLAAVSDAIIDAVRHPKDEDRYQLALRGLTMVARDAWWTLELAVEAELWANDVPIRFGGLRCSHNT